MIPVVSPISWIDSFVRSLALSHHQTKHLGRYVTGLMASRSKTIRTIASMFPDANGSRAMNRFMNESGCEINRRRIEELQKHNETRWSKHGVAIIDDTLLHKTGKRIPNAYNFYDHAEKHFAYAQCITTLHYADCKTNYPLGHRLYARKGEPGHRTKIELAIGMLSEAFDAGMPASTAIFDSWYLCRELAGFITARGRFYIGACKPNLLVRVAGNRYISLGEYVKGIADYREFEVSGGKLLVYTRKVHFKSIGDARLIVSKRGDDIICLATSRADHATKVIEDYMLRWRIEDFYRDAKQNLGLEECQVRNVEGVRRHFDAVFLAHSVLKLGASESVFGRRLLHSSIGEKVKKVCLELLENLALWIMEGKRSIVEVRNMLGLLINCQS